MSRFFALLFITLLAFSAAAGAKEFRGTILSWDQLKHLTPAKRAAYLREYRKVLSMMEDEQRRFGIYEASNAKDDLSEKIAFILDYFSILPQADADGVSETTPTATNTARAAGAPPVYPKWDQTTGGWGCSWANSGENQFMFDQSFGTCVMSFGNKNWTVSNTRMTACPGGGNGFEGSVAIPYDESGMSGKWACVPVTAYNALPQKYQDNLDKGVRLPDTAFNGQANEANTRDMVEGNLKDALAQNSDYNKKQYAQNGKSDDPNPSVDPLGTDTCGEPSAKPCGKPDENDADIAAFRSDSASDANSCIVGGFFSKYDNTNPRKEVGKCHIPDKFQTPSGEEIARCDKPHTAMCNPFVFCMLDASGELHSHCEPVAKSGANVTERCGHYFDAFTSAAGVTDESAGGVVRGKRGKRKVASSPAAPKRGMACDPTSEAFQKAMGASKVGEAWNEQKAIFETNFRKRCMNEGKSQSEKGFQKLFCNECQVMAKTLYKMNKAAINYGCTSKQVVDPPPARASTAPPSAAPQATEPFVQPRAGAATK